MTNNTAHFCSRESFRFLLARYLITKTLLSCSIIQRIGKYEGTSSLQAREINILSIAAYPNRAGILTHDGKASASKAVVVP
jgi:hypothetical protein